MGVSLFHGTEFSKRAFVANGGLFGCEIIPVQGGCALISAHSAACVAKFFEGLGVDRGVWPDYCDVKKADISIDEVYWKSGVLREYLRTVGRDRFDEVPWLSEIAGWLLEGQSILVTE